MLTSDAIVGRSRESFHKGINNNTCLSMSTSAPFNRIDIEQSVLLLYVIDFERTQ